MSKITVSELCRKQGYQYDSDLEHISNVCTMDSVLFYLRYTVEELEEYIFNQKFIAGKQLRDALGKKYIYAETGDKVVIDRNFIEINFGLDITPTEFKKQTTKGKFTHAQLVTFLEAFNDNNLREENDHE